jgi:lycopene beta-cyclase
MSYLAFHLVFILPPLVLLLTRLPHAVERFGGRAAWALPAVAAIALLYTTPWDNYLVYRGVWGYGPDRVLATIGYVPVEEYLFFLFQPLLTGAWTYVLLLRHPDPRHSATMPGGRVSAGDPASDAPAGIQDLLMPPAGPRALGIAVYALVAVIGLFALTWAAGLYLGLILVWAAPVLMVQWYWVARTVTRMPATFAAAIAAPTLYLWVADRFALAAGIWSIAPEHITGIGLAGLPLEEAVFFLVTNVLVVQGVLLFLQPALERAAAPAAVRLAAA